jgi:hypothetical protein
MISVQLDEVKWVEDDREIMISGQMFDIKQYTEENGLLIASGVYDERETTVMQWLGNFNHKQQNQVIITILVLVQSFFSMLSLIAFSDFNKLILHHSSFITEKTLVPYLQKIAPPPRTFLP